MVVETSKPSLPVKSALPVKPPVKQEKPGWLQVTPRFVKTVGPLGVDPMEMSESQKVYAIEEVLATHCSDSASARKALRQILVIHDLPEPENPPAQGPGVAGTPGTVDPIPPDLAALSGVTASPTTAWTTGQYIVLGDASNAYWDGSAWVVGIAP